MKVWMRPDGVGMLQKLLLRDITMKRGINQPAARMNGERYRHGFGAKNLKTTSERCENYTLAELFELELGRALSVTA